MSKNVVIKLSARNSPDEWTSVTMVDVDLLNRLKIAFAVVVGTPIDFVTSGNLNQRNVAQPKPEGETDA